jgi:hypothetical protein
MTTAATELTAAAVSFCGWEAAQLANRFVRVVAVPDIGGRVMAYDLANHPFFFVDPHLAGKLFSTQENQGDGSLAAWKNYGGAKTWPAPQGWETDEQWHGPPDPVLDTGRYRLAALAASAREAELCMISPPDPRTGVEISRRLRLRPASSRVQLDLSFRNIADRSVRWSIWDVAQLAAERKSPDGSRSHDPSCCVTAPINPHSRFPRGFQVMFGDQDNPQWQVQGALFRADYLWQIGKVGLDSPGGWIAFHQGRAGRAFVERFTYFPSADYPDADYPDDGATVECWTVGAGQVANLDYADSGIYLMETEVLSPLYTIAPGETADFALEWASCALNGPVVDVQEGGCASQPLTLRSTGGGAAQLSGQFGIFDAGELRLGWRLPNGELEWRASLGRVDPLRPLVLDLACEPPPPQAGAELYVVAEWDGNARLLAQI